MTSRKIEAKATKPKSKKPEKKPETIQNLAHKINNPLSLIVGNAELLEAYLETGANLEQAAKLAKKIKEAAFHISKILNDFSA